MKPLFISVPAGEHTLEGHPENAGRGQAVLRLLDEYQVLGDLQVIDPQPAGIDQLTRDAQTTLQVASVIGRLFRTAVLYGVHPVDQDRAVIPKHLDEMRGREEAVKVIDQAVQLYVKEILPTLGS